MGRDMNAVWVKKSSTFRTRFDQIVSTSDPIYLREGKREESDGPGALCLSNNTSIPHIILFVSTQHRKDCGQTIKLHHVTPRGSLRL